MPEKGDIRSPVHDAFERANQYYVKDIFDYIEFDGTK